MLLLSTGTLYKYWLNRIFHFAKELEYEGIEIYMNDVVDTRNIEYIKELISRFDLPVLAIHAPKICNITRAKIALKIADWLNVDNLIFRPWLWKDFSYNSWLKNQLPKIQTISRTKLSVVNLQASSTFFFPKYAFSDINSLKKFKYFTLDTAHLVSHGLDLMRVYSSIKKRLNHVYLSDSSKLHTHILPGQGILPLESFLTKLYKDDFEWHVSIAIWWKYIGAGDDTKIKENLAFVRKFYREYSMLN